MVSKGRSFVNSNGFVCVFAWWKGQMGGSVVNRNVFVVSKERSVVNRIVFMCGRIVEGRKRCKWFCFSVLLHGRREKTVF